MTTTWKLTGIAKAAGQCDCCSRQISQRVFEVTNIETGEVRELGRRCAAKATGYKVDRVEREARIAARVAITAARGAFLAAEYPTAAEHVIGTARVTDFLWTDEVFNAEGREYMAAMAARSA